LPTKEKSDTPGKASNADTRFLASLSILSFFKILCRQVEQSRGLYKGLGGYFLKNSLIIAKTIPPNTATWLIKKINIHFFNSAADSDILLSSFKKLSLIAKDVY
jgi:hypothetical protein